MFTWLEIFIHSATKGVVEVARASSRHYNRVTVHKKTRYSLLKVRTAVAVLVIWLRMYSHASAREAGEVIIYRPILVKPNPSTTYRSCPRITGWLYMEIINIWQNLLPYYHLLAGMNIDPEVYIFTYRNIFYKTETLI